MLYKFQAFPLNISNSHGQIRIKKLDGNGFICERNFCDVFIKTMILREGSLMKKKKLRRC